MSFLSDSPQEQYLSLTPAVVHVAATTSVQSLQEWLCSEEDDGLGEEEDDDGFGEEDEAVQGVFEEGEEVFSCREEFKDVSSGFEDDFCVLLGKNGLPQADNANDVKTNKIVKNLVFVFILKASRTYYITDTSNNKSDQPGRIYLLKC